MNKNAPRAAVYTLGCRVNQYESDAVEAELESLGFSMRSFWSWVVFLKSRQRLWQKWTA